MIGKKEADAFCFDSSFLSNIFIFLEVPFPLRPPSPPPPSPADLIDSLFSSHVM